MRPPLARNSGALYLRLGRADVAMFRFLLEAWDNLALMSSLGADASGRETLLLRFAPGLEAEVRRFIKAAQTEFSLELLPVPPAGPGGQHKGGAA